MGILKTLFFVTAPIVGLTVLTFRLGNKLPAASRLFGNYIGLSYVYFKSVLKFVKPVDQMPFEMISLARKTSQQSQALRRELKSTLKRVREDFKTKKEQTFKNFSEQVKVKEGEFSLTDLMEEQKPDSMPRQPLGSQSGSDLIYNMMLFRGELLRVKEQKRRQNKFYESL